MRLRWICLGDAPLRSVQVVRWVAYEDVELETRASDHRVRMNVYDDHADVWYFPNGPGTELGDQLFTKLTIDNADAIGARSMVHRWIGEMLGEPVGEAMPDRLRPWRVHPKTREVMAEIGMYDNDLEPTEIKVEPVFAESVNETEQEFTPTPGGWEWMTGTYSRQHHAKRETPNGTARMSMTIGHSGVDFELNAWDRRWTHSIPGGGGIDQLMRIAEEWANAIVDNKAVDLHSTTDARVWAEEFVRLHRGARATDSDLGLMISWFANAIEVGRSATRIVEDERVPDELIQEWAQPALGEKEAEWVADLELMVDAMRERFRRLTRTGRELEQVKENFDKHVAAEQLAIREGWENLQQAQDAWKKVQDRTLTQDEAIVAVVVEFQDKLDQITKEHEDA